MHEMTYLKMELDPGLSSALYFSLNKNFLHGHLMLFAVQILNRHSLC